MISVLYWSLSGFDSASTFAGEVERPSSTFPRALGLAVVTMLLAYILPLGVASGADPNWDTWRDGSLSAVARRIGGDWLGVWVMASSAVSNWVSAAECVEPWLSLCALQWAYLSSRFSPQGLFASEVLEDSYQLLGMAEAGLAPRCFAKRHATLGTPVRALMLQVSVIALLAGLDFSVIMCVDNFFSAAAAALEFAAAVQLRASRPDLCRPFRIPLGTVGLALFLLIPFGMSVLVMYVTAAHSPLSLALCASATLLGTLLTIVSQLPWARLSDSSERSTMPSALAEDVDAPQCGAAAAPTATLTS